MKPTTSRWLGAILLSFLALSVNLKAQDASTTPPTGANGQQRPHFLRTLGLSDAQKAQIKEIVQSMPRGKERREAIFAVLTPAQQAQLKQDREAWKAQHPGQQ